MHLKYPQKRQGAFSEPPEWLVIGAVLAILTAVVLALVRRFGISAVVIVGGIVALVLWLERRNIIDWVRDRRRRGKDGR